MFLRSSSFLRHGLSVSVVRMHEDAPWDFSTARFHRRLLGIARNERPGVPEEFLCPTARLFRIIVTVIRTRPLGYSESRETNVVVFLRSSYFQRHDLFVLSPPSSGCTKMPTRVSRRPDSTDGNSESRETDVVALPSSSPLSNESTLSDFRRRHPDARKCPT